MIAGLVIIGMLALIFGVGIFFGRCIALSNPTVEEPLPGEPDPRLLDLHHELHTTRWTV